MKYVSRDYLDKCDYCDCEIATNIFEAESIESLGFEDSSDIVNAEHVQESILDKKTGGAQCYTCYTKNEQKRKRRNAASRGKYAALRSCGLVKTPYGWE